MFFCFCFFCSINQISTKQNAQFLKEKETVGKMLSKCHKCFLTLALALILLKRNAENDSLQCELQLIRTMNFIWTKEGGSTSCKTSPGATVVHLVGQLGGKKKKERCVCVCIQCIYTHCNDTGIIIVEIMWF